MSTCEQKKGAAQLTRRAPAPRSTGLPRRRYPANACRAASAVANHKARRNLSRQTCSTGLDLDVWPAAIARRLSTFSDSGPSLPKDSITIGSALPLKRLCLSSSPMMAQVATFFALVVHLSATGARTHSHQPNVCIAVQESSLPGPR